MISANKKKPSESIFKQSASQVKLKSSLWQIIGKLYSIGQSFYFDTYLFTSTAGLLTQSINLLDCKFFGSTGEPPTFQTFDQS